MPHFTTSIHLHTNRPTPTHSSSSRMHTLILKCWRIHSFLLNWASLLPPHRQTFINWSSLPVDERPSLTESTRLDSVCTPHDTFYDKWCHYVIKCQIINWNNHLHEPLITVSNTPSWHLFSIKESAKIKTPRKLKAV